MRERLLHLRDMGLRYACFSDAYRDYKRKYRECLRKARAEAYANHIKSSNNRSKAVWSVAKPSQSVISSDNGPSAEDFANFFDKLPTGAKTPSDLVSGVPPAPVAEGLHRMTVPATYFNFICVSESRVRQVVLNLKNASAPDVYELNTRVIKCLLDELITSS